MALKNYNSNNEVTFFSEYFKNYKRHYVKKHKMAYCTLNAFICYLLWLVYYNKNCDSGILCQIAVHIN